MGIELGQYDPVSNQIDVVADIEPNGNSNPNNFIEVEGELWFTAGFSQKNSTLWRYDAENDTVENISYSTPFGVYPSMNWLYCFG